MVVGGLVTVHNVHLRLHLVPFPVLAHVGGIDLVVEVTDVAHHGTAFQGFEHVRVAHVHVAGGGDQQIGVLQQVAVHGRLGTGVHAVNVRRHNFESVHAGLHGTDGVGLGHFYNHAFLAQGSSRALAYITIANHQGFLACHQVVGSALDGVIQAVATTVFVVVLGLGDRVVHVDGRHLQSALAQHFLQTMHTGGGFFGHAVAVSQDFRVLLMEQGGQIAAVVQNHVRFPAVYIGSDCTLQAPVVLFVGFALPGKHGNALRGDGGRGLVLGGEDVARGPAHVRTQFNQRLDQHGGLDGHVDTAHHIGAFQRLLGFVLLAELHQGRHFAFSDVNFLAAPAGQGNIANFVVVKAVQLFCGSAHGVLLSVQSVWLGRMPDDIRPKSV